MELTLYQQTMTFLWSFALGTAAVIIYIVMEVARELSPPNMILIVTEDILFTGIVTGMNVFFAISQTNGYIRWYVVTAQLLSFSAIYFTLGKFLKHLTRMTVRLTTFLAGKIMLPFAKLSQIILTNSAKIVKKIKK